MTDAFTQRLDVIPVLDHQHMFWQVPIIQILLRVRVLLDDQSTCYSISSLYTSVGMVEVGTVGVGFKPEKEKGLGLVLEKRARK